MGREKIVTVPNPDKEGHHQDARRPGLYPSHPARIIFSGRSGCGKGVAAKNLLARASPPFERIVVWHYDADSLEWADCEPSDVIAELPDDPSQFWDRDEKNLIICDEIPWEQLSKADRLKADRLMQYVASHYNTAVYILHQNFVRFQRQYGALPIGGTCGVVSTMSACEMSPLRLATISGNCFS